MQAHIHTDTHSGTAGVVGVCDGEACEVLVPDGQWATRLKHKSR